MKIFEFFHDKDGCFSMGRLLGFLSFFPATYVVIHSSQGLQWYISAYASSFVGSKIADMLGGKSDS